MTATPAALLRRIRLELARDHDHPVGSREHGYDFIAPVDDNGHILADAWKETRERCRVKRFWGHEDSMVGHLVRKPGGSWAFHYDIHGPEDHDEAGYRFNEHAFIPGEYVSIKEHDGVLRTFKVMSVVELD
jgi:hypothetical protein